MNIELNSKDIHKYRKDYAVRARDAATGRSDTKNQVNEPRRT